MKTLQQPAIEPIEDCAQELLQPPKVDSAVLEYYIYGLHYPASKQRVITQAEFNQAPENVMAFYIYRLPEREFKSPSDVSFTAFMSAYFFGQD